MNLKSTSAGGRMPDLDGLRAIAVLLVLMDHFVSFSFPVQTIRTVTAFGWVGVDLFFVLSGFLIGGILLDHREASNYYRVFFYRRRFLRIVPLYAVLLTPALLVVGLGWQSHFGGHGLGIVNGWTMLAYLCFVQNFIVPFLTIPGYLGPAWSLAVEEQFYLLLPPLVRRLNGPRLIQIMVVAIMVAPLLRAVSFLIFSESGKACDVCYMLLPCRWDTLLLGVLSAYALRVSRVREWLAERVARLRTLWLVLAAGMIGMALSGLNTYHPLIAIGGYTWIAAFFTCTLLLARLNSQGRFRQWLSLPVLKPIATVSYGLYLLQGPVLAVKAFVLERYGCPTIGWTAMGASLLAFAATAVAATVSWRFFESRLIELGHGHSFQRPPAKAVDVKASEAGS
ncbi:MAG: acyltransferase [Verrucomicrobiota bacterium]